MKELSDFSIDPLTRDDWLDVRAIYLDGIATDQATFETDAPSWEEWDAGHLSVCRLAARADGKAQQRYRSGLSIRNLIELSSD